MALPVPPNSIGMGQVRTELGGGSGAQTMSAAGVTLASITSGQKCALGADLGGTSAGDTILLSWGSTIPYLSGEWRIVNHAGHTSPQIITVNFTYSVGYCSDTIYFYTSTNSTSLWSLVATIPKSGSGSFTRTSQAYNDIIRVRWSTIATFGAGITINLNGGTVTSGSGTVSGTAGWNINV